MILKLNHFKEINMKKHLISSAVALTLLASSSLFAKTYATVNGDKIEDNDIAAILSVIPGAKFDALKKEQQKQIIEQAIEKRLLAEKAMKSGIEKEKIYQETLAKMKKDLALEIWMKKQFDAQKVSDAELKDFYKKNEKMFKQPEMAKARHILVKSEADAKKIIASLKKAKNKEATFIKLAKEKSTGPSGPNGGELGWFDKSKMVKPFADAAFALKKGSYTTKPVKTQFGYHVIFLEEKKKAQNVPFAEAKKKIEQSLKVQKFQAHMKELSKGLKAKADIKIK